MNRTIGGVLSEDERFMRLAIAEAAKGAGYVSPNPMVGAIAVKRGRILAKAYHKRYGETHAEVALLRKLTSEEAKGATIYVNLEPCCHFGKTAPCTDALIASKVRRVVVGHEDPNPKVSGRGIKQIRQAGIAVSVGILSREARELNQPFLTFIAKGRPWILLKVAQSMDGRIALANGQSRWISGVEARKEVHRLRSQLDAVLVGARTVAADDPELTVRHVKGRNPIRVVLDSNLALSAKAKIFLQQDPERTWVMTTDRASATLKAKIEKTGAAVFCGPTAHDGHVNLEWVVQTLSSLGVTSVLVEGGGTIHASFIRAELFDKLIVAAAPMLIGNDGIAATANLGLQELSHAPRFSVSDVRKVGEDLWIEMVRDVQRNS